MSATKESLDTSKAPCQSPNGSPPLKAAGSPRPPSPLTIGSINTAFTHKRKPALPKIDIDGVKTEDSAPMLYWRKVKDEALANKPPVVGYSYNYLQPKQKK